MLKSKLPIIAGAVCKLYDDFKDNDTINIYRNDFLMEYLKGIHYIAFTILSYEDPSLFIISCLGNASNSFGNKDAFSEPYEKSLHYSFLLMFAIIDYNKLIKLNKYDIIIILAFIIAMYAEPCICNDEYSKYKFFLRLGILICVYEALQQPFISTSCRNCLYYILGYFFISVIVQIYANFIYKKPVAIESKVSKVKLRKRRKKKKSRRSTI